MRYVPLDEVNEAADSPPACLGAVVQGGCMSGEDDGGPPEWRARIYGSAWWYRWSSFAYCVAGGMLVVRPAPRSAARVATVGRKLSAIAASRRF